jgi:flagellar biosynthesis/type III secretory pathway protein FliH
MSQTKKLPSRIKYEKNNPTVSFRVTKELKDVLKDIKERTNMSYAEIVKEVLSKAKKQWEEAFKQGYDEGHEDVRNEYGIWYNCCVCGEKMFITPNSKAHEEIMTYLKAFRWGHRSCLGGKGY